MSKPNTPRPLESPEIEALKAKARATVPPEIQEIIRQMDHFEYQDENGVDLTLIESNLRLTPTERLRRNYRHRIQTQRLNAYGRHRIR